MLGDRYSVMASRADYADASSDPDARQWVDLVFHEIMQRTLPDQYELRRDVWRVHVVQLDGGTRGAVLGGDCPPTAAAAEMASVAEQLHSRFEGSACRHWSGRRWHRPRVNHNLLIRSSTTHAFHP